MSRQLLDVKNDLLLADLPIRSNKDSVYIELRLKLASEASQARIWLAIRLRVGI